MGNRAGASFRVKAAELEIVGEEKLEGGGKLIDAIVPRFERVAIAFSGKKMNRAFILEPADEPSTYDFEGFSISGRFKIAEKINDAAEASRRFKSFRPS